MERRNIDRGGELISLLLPGLARLGLLIREAKHIMTPICSIYGAFRGFCETKLSHPVLRVASDTCVDTIVPYVFYLTPLGASHPSPLLLFLVSSSEWRDTWCIIRAGVRARCAFLLIHAPRLPLSWCGQQLPVLSGNMDTASLHDNIWPIRGQCSGHVIIHDQSEALTLSGIVETASRLQRLRLRKPKPICRFCLAVRAAWTVTDISALFARAWKYATATFPDIFYRTVHWLSYEGIEQKSKQLIRAILQVPSVSVFTSRCCQNKLKDSEALTRLHYPL